MKQPSRLYAVRPVRRPELPKLPAIEQAGAQLFRDTQFAWVAGDGGMALASFEHWFAHGKIWVAADGADEPVGFVIAHELDGAAYLHELDVHPKHGRQGLGARLVEAVVVWARQQAYPAVTLSTCRDIPWNAPLYTRLGFRLLTDDELGPGLQAVRAEELESGWSPWDRVCMIRITTIA